MILQRLVVLPEKYFLGRRNDMSAKMTSLNEFIIAVWTHYEHVAVIQTNNMSVGCLKPASMLPPFPWYVFGVFLLFMYFNPFPFMYYGNWAMRWRTFTYWLQVYMDNGFVDTFRVQHPDVYGYTYFSYRQAMRQKQKGWRLDYFLVSSSLADSCHDSFILQDFLGSDHCPLGLVLKHEGWGFFNTLTGSYFAGSQPKQKSSESWVMVSNTHFGKSLTM